MEQGISDGQNRPALCGANDDPPNPDSCRTHVVATRSLPSRHVARSQLEVLFRNVADAQTGYHQSPIFALFIVDKILPPQKTYLIVLWHLNQPFIPSTILFWGGGGGGGNEPNFFFQNFSKLNFFQKSF